MQRDNDGYTALMLAAAYTTNTEVFLALLRSGANGSIKNAFGYTAFDYAKKNSALLGSTAYWELNEARFL